MEIVERIDVLHDRLAAARRAGKEVGFVPTMGALHDGHMSLMKFCREENEVCVASIFVNPAQFNNQEDLRTYPRTLEADCALLEKEGCDFVFAPSVEEVYPTPDLRTFDYGSLTRRLEGEFRPGHFDGVLRVVSRLFDIVWPARAYFGRKDYQQFLVVREFVQREGLAITLRPCPTVRLKSGLAFSSRNVRLGADGVAVSALINRILRKTLTERRGKTPAEAKAFVIRELSMAPEFKVEYFDIVNAYTLESAADWTDPFPKVGLIAVYVKGVRLIDHIAYDE
ncbi:MAG: pantoate--beta-alanine ligase, partial [Tannerellaceae bacterium]|nr:pantoate--beta-alanine ligase [Tannerellaceae bacterium]